jgi:hypothetical protein
MLNLGDVVSFEWPQDGYDTGTICKVHTDGTVDVFRPYVHTADFSCSGGEGASAVICYIGFETVPRLNPERVKLLRKSPPLK